MRIIQLAPVLLLWIVAGCSTTSTITNLTPSTLPRNEDGLYPIEMEFTSNQTSLRHDSIRPHVVIGFDFYPMIQMPIQTNRWETLIPVPADQDFVNYRFQIDYDYNDFGGRSQASVSSEEYKLIIVD